MLRSKSRSGSVDFGQKKHYSSVFSRTLSASKLCRGDGVGKQVDATAVKLVDRKSNLSENQADRIISMQQQMRKMDDELRTTKEKLSASLVENSRVVDQLNEAKTMANKSSSPNKASELAMEIDNLKKKLANTEDELRRKDKKIDSLEAELGDARKIEGEKDASMGRLMKEMRDIKEREGETLVFLSDNKKRIQELEAEVERKRKSESRMADSLAVQHNQLDSAMFDLEESKIEIASLHEKIDGLEDLCNQISRDEEIRGLKTELQLTKENLVKAQEEEKKASLRAQRALEEMEMVKKEWKLAVEAEEKSAKAMEDLALALTEVATEANQAKEKLRIREAELERVKEEEKKYQSLLYEAKHEAELHKNTADRLRVEAEESIFAWNGKEMGFVSCIKKSEEERAMTQHENQKLAELLQASREETLKLRDILKQAVNEANAAKAAAGLARDENSSLKDCLSEKEEALHFITRENERLRISEAAAQEHVKQLKSMLTLASSEFKIDEKDQNVILMFHDTTNEENGNTKVTRAFSFDLEDLKFMNEPEDEVLDEDPEKAEALKGSIFDENAETPKSEAKTPRALFRRRMYSSAFLEEDETPKGDDGENLDSPHEGTETDKPPHRRTKTMFQRVGGLLTIRKTFHNRKDSSADLKTPTANKKEVSGELKTNKKEVSGELKTNKKEVSGELKTNKKEVSGELKTQKKEVSGELKTPPAQV